ncbi:hypothetical protein MNBD_GAMMA11-3230 [hydrothermal vent metagenome]|uniref:Type IV pilus biogenesis protein PilE n=1 Tax=hydrothermal vent metagenome TaxID=652676 RepID=A0A3B0X4F9_9ZZZZ
MNKQIGFTLVELMVVVAILGVISTIGMVSYGAHVAKGDRDRGCVMILPEIARDLEIYKQVNGAYAASFNVLNSVLKLSREWSSPPKDTTLKHTYEIVLTNAGQGFTLNCIPAEGRAGLDASGCGMLTYDNFGRRGAIAEAGKSADSCWR